MTASTGSSVCSLCAAGYYANSTYQCAPCPRGSYRPSGGDNICRPCPIGYKTNAASAASTCTECDVGHVVLQETPEVCTPCPMGTYESDRVCQVCPMTGVSEIASVNCVICPNGTYPNTERSACLTCDPGWIRYEGQTNLCEPCPPGYYEYEHAYCLPCPAGTYNDRGGSDSCNFCPVNYAAPDLGSPVCTGCPVGSFTQTTGSPFCSVCPVGLIGLGIGQGCVPQNDLPVSQPPKASATASEKIGADAIGLILVSLAILAIVGYCVITPSTKIIK